ncbi:YpjP family protein [Pontibacillus yanchengensis]|uniref:YpjP-like protein n=1 Tax=Pontibacillus yanchengensis Y32 TaxID=1385514 RepID=A0A0A2TRQ6_9BACI|nr:YpjP family protein [Pontibacillus yanchengensis]KGP71940.1 hypothetical protein N782_14675 [Pontibacillus yanchengensis Y32]
MKLWMRKVSVILITIVTLGMYNPVHLLDTEAAEKHKVDSSNEGVNEDRLTTNEEDKPEEDIEITLHDESSNENNESDYFISAITEQAKEQTVTKLGPKIYDKVEDEFTTQILPGIEQVVEELLVEASKEEVPYYEITELASPGYGEKIFNLYDHKAKQDVAKFHVRRDNRPGEGYWFNFHYHLSQDNFEQHHPIGEIYWDKNTPPKWMA